MGANTGFFATMSYPFWGIPIGAGIGMQIPVVSSAALPAPNDLVTGVIQVADGNDNPTLRPTVPVIVGAGLTQTPGGRGGTRSTTRPRPPSPARRRRCRRRS